jgi:hypothetical protein
MGGINTGRWLAGGTVAAILIWLLEGAGSILYMDDWQASLQALGITFEMNARMWAISVLVSLISGLVLIFLYAAARPRFGPGPKTAMIVACAFWLGGYLMSLIGFYMLGMYPTGLLVTWGVVGLVEMNVAALVGGWIYREGQAT